MTEQNKADAETRHDVTRRVTVNRQAKRAGSRPVPGWWKHQTKNKKDVVNYIFFEKKEIAMWFVLAMIIATCTAAYFYKRTTPDQVWPLGRLVEDVSVLNFENTTISLNTTKGTFPVSVSLYGFKGAKVDLVKHKDGAFYLCVNKKPGDGCTRLTGVEGEMLSRKI